MRYLFVLWLFVCACDDKARLQDFGAVGTFSLTDQDGRAFGSRDLAGRVWVANFIFTNCRTVRPTLTAEMKTLSQRLTAKHKDVQLVSISVDPENDTSTVLKRYAAEHHIDTQRWHFLTGSLSDVRDLVIKRFKQVVGERTPLPNDPSVYDIAHSTRFVLVDQEGKIRAFVGLSDSDPVAAIENAIEALNAQ